MNQTRGYQDLNLVRRVAKDGVAERSHFTLLHSHITHTLMNEEQRIAKQVFRMYSDDGLERNLRYCNRIIALKVYQLEECDLHRVDAIISERDLYLGIKENLENYKILLSIKERK